MRPPQKSGINKYLHTGGSLHCYHAWFYLFTLEQTSKHMPPSIPMPFIHHVCITYIFMHVLHTLLTMHMSPIHALIMPSFSFFRLFFLPTIFSPNYLDLTEYLFSPNIFSHCYLKLTDYTLSLFFTCFTSFILTECLLSSVSIFCKACFP